MTSRIHDRRPRGVARWQLRPLLAGRGRAAALRLQAPPADRRRRRRCRPTTASAIRSRSRKASARSSCSSAPARRADAGAARRRRSPSRSAGGARRPAGSSSTCRPATANERAAAERCARSESILAAAGVPPQRDRVRPYQPADPASSAPQLNYPRMAAEAGRAACGRTTSARASTASYNENRPVLESRLRHPAQSRRHGRQPGRPGAAARRDAGLHGRRTTVLDNTARARAPRPPIPGYQQRQDQRRRQMIKFDAHKRVPSAAAAPRRRRATSISRRRRASRSRRSARRVETAAAMQAAGEDRRMAKAHLKIQMGGIAAAVEAYRSSPTPNVIMIEIGEPRRRAARRPRYARRGLRRRHARRRHRPASTTSCSIAS